MEPASSPAARQETMRRHNLGLVLRQVLATPVPPSRADIAVRTGLTRPTVSALVDRLIEAGMVTELPPVASRRAGRPAVPLAPARGTFAAIGLEVNVSYLGARALDLAGEVLTARVEVHNLHDSSPNAVLDLLASLTVDVVEELAAKRSRVLGGAIALPGLVDRSTGTLRLAPNLGWHDLQLAEVLAREPFASMDVVELGNEANLAAWAEARAHPDAMPSFLYVSGEVGIGGGLVYKGEVFQGQRGWSGELGHTTVEPDGPECACGSRGCLESYAGRDAVMTTAGLDPLTPVDELLTRLADGSAPARHSLERAGWALGVALANAVNLLDIDEIMLGGFYAPLTDALAAPVQEQLRKRVISTPWSRPTVRRADGGQHAAMTGAALSVLRGLVADPTAWGPSTVRPSATSSASASIGGLP